MFCIFFCCCFPCSISTCPQHITILATFINQQSAGSDDRSTKKKGIKKRRNKKKVKRMKSDILRHCWIYLKHSRKKLLIQQVEKCNLLINLSDDISTQAKTSYCMQMLREWNKSQLITRHIWSELTCPYTSKSPTVHQNPHKFIKRTLFYKQDTIIKLLGKSGDYLSMIRCCWSGLWFSSNFLSSDLSHFILFAVALKLAVVPFLLEELDVVVLAVELSFMCNIVWWAYGATSMGAFEAASMVWCPINRNLLRT